MEEEASLKKESNTRRLLVIAGLVITALLIGGGLVFAGYKLAEQRKVPQLAPVLGCNRRCNLTINPPRTCGGGLVCWTPPGSPLGASGFCRNPNCPEREDCVCPSPSKPTEAPSEATPAAEAPTSAPTTSPTAGWETYTNADYGYQFKHPQGWTFTVDILNEDPSTALYVIRQGIKSNNIDDYHILVHTWDNPEKLTLSEWLQFMKDSNALPLPVEDMDLTPNTKVGGEEALQFWSDPLSGGKEPGKC